AEGRSKLGSAARTSGSPPRTRQLRTSRSTPWRRCRRGSTRARSSPPATSRRSSRSSPGSGIWTGACSTAGRRISTAAIERRRISRVATFRVDFLGCKVSHADVHEVREPLLRDGHVEAQGAADADVAVISTCCVTNEAVAKSRKAAARAARTHGRVYVTGCAANLQENAFATLPP